MFAGPRRALLVTKKPYTGPGDIVSGATAWYGLRAYSAAVAATRTQKAINLRRASDNATQDILILATGALDIATASAFLGGSSGFVTEWYDQSGNNNHVTQSTGAAQPALVLSGGTYISFSGGQALVKNPLSATVSQPSTFSAVAERSASFTSIQRIVSTFSSSGQALSFYSTTGEGYFYAGSALVFNISNSTLHAIQAVGTDTTSSVVNVDGTETTGNASTGANADFIVIGADIGGTSYLTGIMDEVGLWPSAFTSGQRGSMCQNQRTYWRF